MLPRQARVDHGVAGALVLGGVLACAYAQGHPPATDILPIAAAYHAYGRPLAGRRRQGDMRVRALRRMARGTWQARCAGRWHAVLPPKVTEGPGWIHFHTRWDGRWAEGEAEAAGTHALPAPDYPAIDATVWRCHFSRLAWRRARLLARTHQTLTLKGDR